MKSVSRNAKASGRNTKAEPRKIIPRKAPAKGRTRGPSAKKAVAPHGFDAYLAGVPEPAHSTLIEVRDIIRSVVPSETIETISYGIPTFKYKGPLFAFAAFSKHCSLFPMNARLIAAYKNELKGYQTAKGTIRFPLDKPPPASLIKRLVKERVAQNERKTKRS